jgi:WD40 repeat protein
MRVIGEKVVWLLALCVLATLATGVEAQQLREISSSRVIEITPEFRVRHQPPVITGVAIQPGGEMVASVGDDHLVRLWDLSDGHLLRRLETHLDWVRCAAFSPDGSVLATAGNDGLIVFWDPITGRVIRKLVVPHATATLVYSPDGKLLAAAGFGSQLYLYDTETGKLARQFGCHCHDVRCAAFSPAGDRIAAAGRDGQIHLWRLSDGELIHDIAASRRRLRGITFSHDGGQLIVAGEDRMVRVFGANNGQEILSLSTAPAKVLALVAYAPGRLATAGSDNQICLWDLAAGRETARLAGHTGSVAALDSSGEILVSGSFDTTVRIWPIGGFAERDDRAVRPTAPAIR